MFHLSTGRVSVLIYFKDEIFINIQLHKLIAVCSFVMFSMLKNDTYHGFLLFAKTK